jgi:hypothetical protein
VSQSRDCDWQCIHKSAAVSICGVKEANITTHETCYQKLAMIYTHKSSKAVVPKPGLPSRGADSTKLLKLECKHARKGLVLPRTSHSGKIALEGSYRLRSKLAAAPALSRMLLSQNSKTK